MKFLRVGIVVILIALVSNNIIAQSIAEYNYSYNKVSQLDLNITNENGYITTQKGTKGIRFGLGDSSTYGCGWIATYNLFNYYGFDKDVATVVKYFDRFGANFFGYWGTDPVAILRYLKANGLDAAITSNENNFEKYAINSGGVIFLYISKDLDGAHYIMARHVGNGAFQTYIPNTQTSIENYLGGKENHFNFLIYIK